MHLKRQTRVGFLKLFVPPLAAALMLGCASEDKPWVKDNTPHTAAEQALEECKYQAEAATIGIGAGSHPKTFGKAIGQGIGDGIVRAMDENELIEHCMKAKGFAR